MGGSFQSVDDTCCVFQAVEICTSGGGGGGGMAIGGAITGGTADQVLYVGLGGVLAQDADFVYYGAAALALGDSTATGELSIDGSAGGGGLYASFVGSSVTVTDTLFNLVSAEDLNITATLDANISATVDMTLDATVNMLLTAGGQLDIDGNIIDITATTSAFLTAPATTIASGTGYIAEFTAADLRLQRSDTSSNVVIDALEVLRTTSNVPAAGIGVGVILSTLNSNNTPVNAARLAGSLTTVTAGSESSKFTVTVLDAGATATPLTVNGDGVSSAGVLEMASDPTAAVSAANGVRLRSNAGVFEVSEDAGAYVPVRQGAGAIDVEVITASQAAGALANGVEYIPFVQGAGDTMAFQFRAPVTGSVVVRVGYVMSAANGGGVVLTMDRLIANDGDDPSAALTAGTAFTVTPGNDTNKHTVDASVTAHTTLTVVENDAVRCVLERGVGGSDTHTGDMRVLNISVVPV